MRQSTLLTVAASDGIAIAERLSVSCPPRGGDRRLAADDRFKVDPARGAFEAFRDGASVARADVRRR